MNTFAQAIVIVLCTLFLPEERDNTDILSASPAPLVTIIITAIITTIIAVTTSLILELSILLPEWKKPMSSN